LSTRIQAFGEGPPIWLLHSLLADAGSCLKLAELLRDSHRVLVPDLPGFGGSSWAGPGLDATADALAAAMETPAVVFGNGYGSFVALTLALLHPARVTKLILAGTGAAFSEPGREAFRFMAAAAEAKGLGAIADVAMRRLFAPDFQVAHPELLGERRARFLETEIAVFTGACTALAALDLRDAVRRLQVPTLIIVGAQDEATPPAMALELATLVPHAQLIELEGCAHVPQLQAPDRVMEAMRGFLSSSEL
jgi:3-oxoadipate enol-lactonase